MVFKWVGKICSGIRIVQKSNVVSSNELQPPRTLPILSLAVAELSSCEKPDILLCHSSEKLCQPLTHLRHKTLESVIGSVFMAYKTIENRYQIDVSSVF